MDILVVGGGGREHALVRKLRESSHTEKIYCAPGNGGISADAECVDIKATDIERMVAFAASHRVGLVVVAPDDPLVLGMADAMRAAGIKTFGPSRVAARIEGSKVFSKRLMKRYAIPTAAYEVFEDVVAAIDYLKAQNQYPAVIKADGLALGKGVIIAEDFAQAEQAVRSMLEENQFGVSGSRIIIEAFLTGPEVSVLSFCDGETVVPMISSMDHKRALDGDHGLNTGGMGTVAPNKHYTTEIAQHCMDTIFTPTLAAMRAEGCPFSGCLYFGLILTPDGPKVIEYNCRFGDPEAQVVLPLLQSDLVEIMLAIEAGDLAQTPVNFSEESAACVILASGGYPASYQTGYRINGLDVQGQRSDAVIYHAGSRRQDAHYYTAGGRVLGVACVASDLEAALDAVYGAVQQIEFEQMHYRRDIGKNNS